MRPVRSSPQSNTHAVLPEPSFAADPCQSVDAGSLRPDAAAGTKINVFGTRVEVIVVSPEAEQGRQAIPQTALREFDRLHRAYHAWQPSELTALNLAISEG